jgi:serine protease
LSIIDAEEAWDITQGSSTQRIGIADTGLIRGHEDVGSRAVRGFDFISSASAGNDGNGRDSNFEDAGDACGTPSSFHGTHVAGTIGAIANNSRGVTGLNFNAGLVVARVLGRCGGSSVDILEGAAWMAGAQISGIQSIGNDRVQVMNLSLGGPNACSSFEQQVVDFVDSQGALFVAAAGNDGGPVGAPANCARAVTVAAFGRTGNLASYSSFGSSVEIVAPGGDFGDGVLSTIGPSTSGYAFNQGTSMAAPHVTGAISLMQAAVPGLTRQQIVTALRASGVTCGNCGGVPALNILASLQALGATAPTSPPETAPPETPVTDDIFEQNDTLATATLAGCNIDDNRLIAAPEDRDFFTLTPPAGRQLTVSISAANGADLDLYVTDVNGNILARSETATGDETISGRTSGNRLGVFVNPYVDPNTGTRHSGPYRLRIICTSTTAAAVPGEEDQFGSVVSADGEIVGTERTVLLPDEAREELESSVEEGGCSAMPVAPSLLMLVVLVKRRRK